MDYEQDEQEEPMEEQATESQAEDMEIDDEDAPYLDLRSDRKHQAYAMIKSRSFGRTRAFKKMIGVKLIPFAGWVKLPSFSRTYTDTKNDGL